MLRITLISLTLFSHIIHECDIIEDVAISHGFNNIVKRIPPTNTIGNQVTPHAVNHALRYSVKIKRVFHLVIGFKSKTETPLDKFVVGCGVGKFHSEAQP